MNPEGLDDSIFSLLNRTAGFEVDSEINTTVQNPTQEASAYTPTPFNHYRHHGEYRGRLANHLRNQGASEEETSTILDSLLGYRLEPVAGASFPITLRETDWFWLETQSRAYNKPIHEIFQGVLTLTKVWQGDPWNIEPLNRRCQYVTSQAVRLTRKIDSELSALALKYENIGKYLDQKTTSPHPPRTKPMPSEHEYDLIHHSLKAKTRTTRPIFLPYEEAKWALRQLERLRQSSEQTHWLAQIIYQAKLIYSNGHHHYQTSFVQELFLRYVDVRTTISQIERIGQAMEQLLPKLEEASEILRYKIHQMLPAEST